MIPYMMICKAIIAAGRTGSVKKEILENQFNVKINGRDIIKLLDRLRAKEDVQKAIYVDDEFTLKYKEA